MGHHNTFSDPRFWVAVSFTLFFLIFGKRLVNLVTSGLDRRAVAIQTELDGAARLRREAEVLLAEARSQREVALQQAKAMLEQARVEAGRVAVAAQADAVAAADRRERLAMERIAAAEKAAITDVRLAAADIASRAAGEVMQRGFDAEADGRLIDHAIMGLPAALAGRRAT